MFDDTLEKMRCDGINYINSINKKLIEDWCREAGVVVPVGYYNDLSNNTMVVYTNKPGYLIGYKGKYVNKFIEGLNKTFSTKDYKVKFVEIKGDIVNCH